MDIFVLLNVHNLKRIKEGGGVANFCEFLLRINGE